MKLYLDNLNKIIQLEINEEDSTNNLREKIEDIEFIPSNLQTLIVGTRILEEGILRNVIEDGELISLSIDLKGGMRKKWKKKRTRRLQRLRRKQRMRSK